MNRWNVITVLSLLLARDGVMVHEWYAPGWGPNRRHSSASMAKAVVAGLSLALGLGDGRFRPDDPVALFLPSWRADSVRASITFRQLATHSSGLVAPRHPEDVNGALEAWEAAYWNLDPNPFPLILGRTPVVVPPGTRYRYSGPGYGVLACALTAALAGEPEPARAA